MRVMGIDPGIARCGWGVIVVKSAACKAQNYGCIETAATMSVEKRLQHIYRELTDIISKESPEIMVIEELFFNTNAKTALIVGQARGVMLLCAAEKALPVAVYTPLQVKIAVAGYGRAEKRQVGNMVKVILGLSSIPKPDDVADALAIAITHAFSAKIAAKISSS